MTRGVSVVVPVKNGARYLRDTFAAILAQDDGRPIEILFVDDGSTDDSPALLREFAATSSLVRIVQGHGRGASAALNTGLAAARHPLICQIDQDVVVGSGWMNTLTAMLDDPSIAAAQGYFETDRTQTLCARAMGFDLEQRYANMAAGDTTHVCTGNTVYRASALEAIGGFDESLGYGNDNDVSYRLATAGFRLVFNPAARSLHRWREGLAGYVRQQYGFGYGRLDVVAKHPARAGGDSVSPAPMMLHPLLLLTALLVVCGAFVSSAAGLAWQPSALFAAALVLLLIAERTVAGIRAARRFKALTPLAFPVLHLVRDLAWVAAMAVWAARRIAGRRPEPAHSMRARV